MSTRNRIADENFKLSKACPAAASSAQSAELDLGGLELGPVGGALEIVVTIPATDTLAENETITVELEHSDVSGSGHVSIPGTGNIKATGASGDVSDEVVVRLYLPPGTKRYLRFNITTSATSGDVTDTTVTLEGRV